MARSLTLPPVSGDLRKMAGIADILGITLSTERHSRVLAGSGRLHRHGRSHHGYSVVEDGIRRPRRRSGAPRRPAMAGAPLFAGRQLARRCATAPRSPSISVSVPDGTVRSSSPDACAGSFAGMGPTGADVWPSALPVAASGHRSLSARPVSRAEFPAIESHSRPVVNVDFGGAGVLSSSEDGTTKLWDRRSSGHALRFPGFRLAGGLQSAGSRRAGPFAPGRRRRLRASLSLPQ